MTANRWEVASREVAKRLERGELVAVVPGMTDLTAPYWAAARDGRLVLQECRGCGHPQHPPLPACPRCHSTDLGWREASGEGTVYTCTVVRHPTHFAFAGQVPYLVALVELAEGPRLVTGITGIAPEQVRAGMRVRVVFRPVTAEVTLPYFEPAGDGPGDASASL